MALLILYVYFQYVNDIVNYYLDVLFFGKFLKTYNIYIDFVLL